ncbi:TIGR04376 family protein, partial [Geminocystis sp. GBBB08]|uniref:TIGR04376 family protein n=1 Tax=Geminocystis sp. GBBB08 TaxID=2604140 RepID=UPI0027E37CD3
MGIFEDFTFFLESRLEDFLQNNPQLNLTIIAQELNTQKQDTIKSITRLELEQKKVENDILSLGKEIQIWFDRMNKAEKLRRLDLAKEAENRKNLLLNQGNLLWQEMEKTKEKIIKNKELLISLETKEQEVNLKIAQLKTKEQNNYKRTNDYNKYSYYN